MGAEKTTEMLSNIEPELVENEWYVPYNVVLGIQPENTPATSCQAVYWKCLVCSDIYRMSVKDRLDKKHREKKSCFRCRGRVQLHPFTI